MQPPYQQNQYSGYQQPSSNPMVHNNLINIVSLHLDHLPLLSNNLIVKYFIINISQK